MFKKHIGLIIICVISLIIGMFAQLYSLLCLTGYFHGAGFFKFFIMDIIGVCLCSSVSFLMADKKYRGLFFYLSFLVGGMLPVFGFISVFAILLLKCGAVNKPYEEEDFDISLDEGIIIKNEGQQIQKSDDEAFRELLDLEPIKDILENPDYSVELKRSAIEKLSNKDDKGSINLLKDTLLNNDPEIRFYASTALKKIEQQLQRGVLAIKEEVSLNPYSPDQYLLLAKEYFRFSKSGLADETTSGFYLCQSWEAIEKAIELKKLTSEVLLEAGKIKIALREYEDALKYLDMAYEKDQNNWQIMIWRCEAYFHLGTIDKIKNDCEKIELLKPQWGSVRDITGYWVEHA